MLTLVLTGCATTGTNGIVSIGPNLYMVGGLGTFTDFSSSGVKERLYGQAALYCMNLHRVVLPVTSTGRDSGLGTYATAEIQFQCVTPDDPRIQT